MNLKFEGETGIVCKYGTFEPDREYRVSEKTGKALLKIAGFKEVKTKKEAKKS